MSGTVASRMRTAVTVARGDVARVAKLLAGAEPGSARAVKLAAELEHRKDELRRAEQNIADAEAERAIR